MTGTNGNSVTRAELAAHIKGIDARFDTVEADLAEIKWGINVVLETRRTRWRAYAPGIIAALIAALVPVALLTH